MAIALDGTAVVGPNTAFDRYLTLPSVAVGSGSDRVLLVGISYYFNSGTPTVTRNGQTLVAANATAPTTGGLRVMLFTLVAPNTGTYDVVADWGAGAEVFAGGYAQPLTGVNQTTPLQRWTTATGFSATPSVTVASVATGELTVDIAAAFASPSAVGAGQTYFGSMPTTLGGSYASFGSYDASSTGSVVQSYTIPLDDWVIAGAAMNPASGGGGGATPARAHFFPLLGAA